MKVNHTHIEIRDFISRIDHLLKNEEFEDASKIAPLLRDEIRAHQEQEESSEGWFQEAAKRAPRLNPRISELVKQHQKLIHLVKAMCSENELKSFSENFSEFATLFTRHDREEDGIIEEVFYQDDASQ